MRFSIPTAALALAVASFVALPEAVAKESAWSRAKKPTTGKAEAIGGYSAGCVRAAAKMPMEGKGFQVMRPSRRRYFGHPSLIAYIQSLADKMHVAKIGPLLVGDLGQPMGGPSPHGHASHQSGLDVDLWFWHPKKSETRLLTRRERERVSAHRIVDPKKKKITKYWSDEVEEILRLAASDSAVSRIFVNPVIKKRLCESKSKDRNYLQKIRPWYGHADHMHVRLHCPKGSDECEAQDPLKEGDGCEELDWWLDDEAQAARKKGQKKYQKTVGALPELPASCDEMAGLGPSLPRE